LYATHWPFRQYESARGVRKSALHDRLARPAHASARRSAGNGPIGMRPPACTAAYEYSYGRQNWFEHSAREHRAVRGAVGLFDQSSFAKFRLEGADAMRVLNRVCANDVDGGAGKDRLYAMAERARRDRGGPHRDALERDRLFDRDGRGNRNQGLQLAQAAHRSEAHCVLTNVTSGMGVLSLMGPQRARTAAIADAR
jgi:glycine cleavage system aminomethyltransferase T